MLGGRGEEEEMNRLSMFIFKRKPSSLVSFNATTNRQLGRSRTSVQPLCSVRTSVLYELTRTSGPRTLPVVAGSSINSFSSLTEYSVEELLTNIQREREMKKKDENKKIQRKERQEIYNINELVEFLKLENATDICVIKVPPCKQYVSYFVICTGANTRHINRMAKTLAFEMKYVRIFNDQRVIVEGEDGKDWLAVDLGDSVVHFMTQEARDKYELERLWCLGYKYDDQTKYL